MRSSVAAAARSMPHNSHDGDPSIPRNSHDGDGRLPPSIPVNRLEYELTGAIQTALSRAGLSNKEAAILQGIDPAQWSRQLHGPEHPSLRRMLRLGPRFWSQFVPALAQLCEASVGPDPRWELLMATVRAIFAETPLPARTHKQLKVGAR
jgi:hypothetical protein